jgi:photosystem II stability/assembly factor-like uncharacterized protein
MLSQPLFRLRTVTGILLSSLSFASVFIIVSAPANAEWRTNGPFGGEAELIRVVPKSAGHVIAGAHNGLIFESKNGGASWNDIPFSGQLSGVLHALEVDPRSDGTWYAGLESEHAWMSGVYKTSDAGQTWQLLPGMKGKAIWSMAVWSEDPNVIAAGAADGVYRSDDAGATWRKISPDDNEDLRPVVSLAFNPSEKDTLFAGTTHLPWRTKDGGATWESIHQGMIDDSDVFSIQVDTHQPDAVFASACSGLYASADNANHWSKLPTPKGAFRTWFVALDPKHSNSVFAGTTEGLLHSEDRGRTWRLLTSQPVRSIAFDPLVAGRIFMASPTMGLVLSTDGGKTLHESNFGFTNRNFTTLTAARGVMYASSAFEGGSGGIYKTDNFGLRWQKGGVPAGQQFRLISVVPDQPATVFAAGYHGLMKTKDGGKTWSETESPAGSVTSLLALPHDVVLAGTDRGLFRKAGASWQAVDGTSGSISSLELSGTEKVAAVGATGAFASLDGGQTWLTCGVAPNQPFWYGIAFEAGSSHTALAATSAGLYRSTDDCKSWSPVTGGLLASTVSVVIFHPVRPGEAFASQDGRIFQTTDSGQHWSVMDDPGDSSAWPAALLVLPEAPGRLFALFPRRGVASKMIEIAQLQK